MKQLIRPRGLHRRSVDRRRRRTADPAVAAELAVIADMRRSQIPTITN